MSVMSSLRRRAGLSRVVAVLAVVAAVTPHVAVDWLAEEVAAEEVSSRPPMADGAVAAGAPSESPGLEAVIRTTSFGVPHVLAADYAGAGFGVGYAFAEGHSCTMADQWVTLSAERSAHFGPGEGNLASDFFWQKIIDDDLVGELLKDTGPTGVLPEVRELVRGYVAGYNRYLTEVGFEIPDPRCEDATWIRPITERDVYHQLLYWDLLSFMLGELDLLAATSPPTAGVSGRGASASTAVEDTQLHASNMIALGADATVSGNGMVFANPHWEWTGPVSFFEAHITIPGEINVSGMTPHGLPTVAIGHNATVGWSHTASTSTRSMRYRLDLAEGSPTTYVVDGVEHEMVPTTATVNVRNASGDLEPVEHTFYDTRFGLVSASPERPWTMDHAFTFKPASLNLAGMNMWVLYARAQTVEGIHAASAATLGVQWINVAASDSNGDAYYAMPNAVPNLTPEQLETCAVADGVLDGSRAGCDFISDPAAPYEGVAPAEKMPFLFRTDYVQNSNDSHWLTNPRQPLEGFSSLYGPERTEQSHRTRHGINLVERRLAGTDGRPGPRFTRTQLIDTTFDGGNFLGRLWQDELVSFCQDLAAAEPAERLGEACNVLEAWGTTDELDDPGAVLFRRFVERSGTEADRFRVPFDVDDPLNTPRGLRTSPAVADALTTAVDDLVSNGIPLDATLRGYQYYVVGDERMPVPGGPFAVGDAIVDVYKNVDFGPFQGADGWEAVGRGSSFVMWVEFTPAGPVGKQILIQSQSSNPASPHFADQTRLFSQGRYKDILFTEDQIASDPELTVRVLRTPPVECTTVLTGRRVGPLTVANGLTCLDHASVTGPVTVRPGAGLSAIASRVSGPFTASGASEVTVCGTALTGPIRLTASSLVILGDPTFGCARNTISGPVTITRTSGPTVIGGNRITGPLTCTGNDPPPVDNQAPNVVAGPTSGQCASLGSG